MTNTDHDQALDVLRAVWGGTGQAADVLADAAEGQRSCTKMADVSFEDFGEGGADLATAWRARLAREGKLRPAAPTVADLVLGEHGGTKKE